jgi:hypothetical protein
MFEYYVQLWRDLQLPVLPIGVFLRVGLDGIGWDASEERFWEQTLVRFEYAYAGLPALDAERYVTGETLLGVALSALMRVPAARRAELHAEALKRIAQSRENDWRRFLLAECLEAYANLDEAQRQQLQALLATPQYQEVKPIMITTYERGKMAGQFEMAVLLLEAKFGTLPEPIKQRVEALSPDELRQLPKKILQAETLKELGLAD